jgi:hypothetical protein
VELLRDWIGVGMWPSFLFASCSAMVEGAMQQGGVVVGRCASLVVNGGVMSVTTASGVVHGDGL